MLERLGQVRMFVDRAHSVLAHPMVVTLFDEMEVPNHRPFLRAHSSQTVGSKGLKSPRGHRPACENSVEDAYAAGAALETTGTGVLRGVATIFDRSAR